MTEGNFSEESLFTSNSLKDMLGVKNSDDNLKENDETINIEALMTAVEDVDDVNALNITKNEAAHENEEFDENALVLSKDLDENETSGIVVTPTNTPSNIIETSKEIVDYAKEEKDMEIEFATWQANIGPDLNSIENALRPIERYAMKLHIDIDPYYSIYYIQELQRLESIINEGNDNNEQWDVIAIEREREEDEYRALAEGELLATNLTKRTVIRLKSWFLSERLKRKQELRVRLLTGAGWNLCIDSLTKIPFWYDNDTGSASYAIPKIIQEQELMKTAYKYGYSALSRNILLNIFSYLNPYPDRMKCSLVCANWKNSVFDEYFHLHVLSIESGARDVPTKLIHKNMFSSIYDAINSALPGDTIVLESGHHWETNLIIQKPIKILCQIEDSLRCIIEITGIVDIITNNSSVVMNSITIRKSNKKLSKILSCINCRNTKLLVSKLLSISQ